MNVDISVTSTAKSLLYTGDLNFSTHTFKMILMRDGFGFNPDKHLSKLNVKSVSSSAGIIVYETTNTIVRTVGSFLDDGHVPGSLITVSGGSLNDGEIWEISDISADGLTMYVNIPDGQAIADETKHSNGDNPETFHYHEFTATLTVDEELANGTAGYTTGGITITFGTSPELTLNGFDFSTIGGTDALQASGGALIIDDTESALADKYVVAYASFTKWGVPL